LDPELLLEVAAGYGVEVDFEGTVPIMEQYGLSL
jgi:hypothetical protein